MTAPFDELGRAIRGPLGEGPDDLRRVAQRRRLLRDADVTGHRRRRRRARRLIVAGAALAASAAILLFVLLPSSEQVRALIRDGGKTIAEGQWLEAKNDAVDVDFSEGSKLMLRSGARARLAAIRSDRVQVVLEAGNLAADISTGHRIVWTYQAGPYRVRVLGTQLDISWNARDAVFEVGVARGSVSVSGGNISGELVVRAGHRVKADQREVRLFRPPRRPAVPPRPPEPDSAVEEVVADSAPAPAAAKPDDASRRPVPRRPARPPRWKQLAKAGQYAAAVAAAQKLGWQRLMRRAASWDLLLLADAARLSASPALARTTLLRIRKRFAGQKPASLAAFRLGRLAFDQRGDYKGAARWFARFLKEAPTSSLVADARGRLMLSYRRSGNNTAASKTAKEYLARHPKGSYAAAAAAIVGK